MSNNGAIVKDITKAEQSPENTYLPADYSRAETWQAYTNVAKAVGSGFEAAAKIVDQDTKMDKLAASNIGGGSGSKKLNQGPLAEAAIQLRDMNMNRDMNDSQKQLYTDRFMRWAFESGYDDDDIKGVSDRVGLNLVASKTVEAYQTRQAERANKTALRREEEAMKMFPMSPSIEDALTSLNRHEQASLILAANTKGKGITPAQVKTAMYTEVSDLFRANESALGNSMMTQDLVRLENLATQQLVDQYKVDPSTARMVAADVRDAYDIAVKNNADDLAAVQAQVNNYKSVIENEAFIDMSSQTYTLEIPNKDGSVENKTMSGSKLYWLAKNAPEAFNSFMFQHPDLKTQLGKAMLSSSVSPETVKDNVDGVTAAALLKTIRSSDMLNTIKSNQARYVMVNGAIGGLKKVFTLCNNSSQSKTLSSIPFVEYNRTLEGVDPEVFSRNKDSLASMSNEAIVSNATAFKDSIILVDSNGTPRLGRVLDNGSFDFDYRKVSGDSIEEFNNGKGIQTLKFIKNFARMNGMSISKAAEEYNKITLASSEQARTAYKASLKDFDFSKGANEIPTDAFIMKVNRSVNGNKDSKDFEVAPVTMKIEGETQVSNLEIPEETKEEVYGRYKLAKQKRDELAEKLNKEPFVTEEMEEPWIAVNRELREATQAKEAFDEKESMAKAKEDWLANQESIKEKGVSITATLQNLERRVKDYEDYLYDNPKDYKANDEYIKLNKDYKFYKKLKESFDKEYKKYQEM